MSDDSGGRSSASEGLQANGHEEFLYGDVDASSVIFESHVVVDSAGVH